MGRTQRQISENGVYHIYFCGINKQNIFCDDKDREKLLSLLTKNKNDFELFAYCFRSDRVNLLIKEYDENTVSKPIQRILTAYASYFNRKYKRSGGLFENRYKSLPISDSEIFDVINYIHKLPKNYANYKWSSYSDLKEGGKICGLDISSKFDEIHDVSAKPGLDPSDINAVRFRQLEAKLRKLSGKAPEEIASLPKSERDAVLKMLRENGFTIGQLMKLTGISRSIVTRSNKEKIENKQNDKDIQIFLL